MIWLSVIPEHPSPEGLCKDRPSHVPVPPPPTGSRAALGRPKPRSSALFTSGNVLSLCRDASASFRELCVSPSFR